MIYWGFLSFFSEEKASCCSGFIMCKRLWDPSEGLGVLSRSCTDPTPRVPHRCALGPATAVGVGTGQTMLWGDLMVIPDQSAPYLSLECSESRDTWLFYPIFLDARCVQSQKEDKSWSRWVPSSSSWGYLEKMLWAYQRCLPYSTAFFSVLWGGQSSQSFLEETERAGIMTWHDCRMRSFGLVCYIWHKIPCF